jgi:hypothetical protein
MRDSCAATIRSTAGAPISGAAQVLSCLFARLSIHLLLASLCRFTVRGALAAPEENRQCQAARWRLSL